MIAQPLREARLRSDAADRFPDMPVGVWLPAASLAARMLRPSANGTSTSQAIARLPGEAFEFRGGAPELIVRSRARTRWMDHPGFPSPPDRPWRRGVRQAT